MAEPRLEDLEAPLLDEDGNITMETDANGFLQVATLSGIEYVIQSCRIRLQTVLGESVYHPEMGLPMAAIERVYDETFTRGSVMRCLSLDPDVREVPEVRLEMEGDVRTMKVAADVLARSDQEGTVEVPIL